jgi:hypothetical protein
MLNIYIIIHCKNILHAIGLDDPLEEYETQYFGFTPKSFMNGGNDVTFTINSVL